jgi:hypothetical protein
MVQFTSETNTNSHLMFETVLKACTYCFRLNCAAYHFGALFACHWIFDKTCGPCMMVPPVIAPEITMRLPTQEEPE